MGLGQKPLPRLAGKAEHQEYHSTYVLRHVILVKVAQASNPCKLAPLSPLPQFSLFGRPSTPSLQNGLLKHLGSHMAKFNTF